MNTIGWRVSELSRTESIPCYTLPGEFKANEKWEHFHENQ
jgi:hypothetical protein